MEHGRNYSRRSAHCCVQCGNAKEWSILREICPMRLCEVCILVAFTQGDRPIYTGSAYIPIVQGRYDISQGKWCFFFLLFKFLCVGISSYSTSCPTCTENDHVRTRGEGNAQQGKTLACSSWLFPFVVTRFWMGELMGRYRSFWAVGRFRLFQSVSGRFLG